MINKASALLMVVYRAKVTGTLTFVVIGYEVLGDRLVMTSVIAIIALDYIQDTTELVKVVFRERCAITLMKCMSL